MDPYKILGIERGASESEIKAAFRKMSVKFHPDVGGDAWVFKQVQEAYEQLTNRTGRHSHKQNSRPRSEPPDAPEQKSQSDKHGAEARERATHSDASEKRANAKQASGSNNKAKQHRDSASRESGSVDVRKSRERRASKSRKQLIVALVTTASVCTATFLIVLIAVRLNQPSRTASNALSEESTVAKNSRSMDVKRPDVPTNSRGALSKSSEKPGKEEASNEGKGYNQREPIDIVVAGVPKQFQVPKSGTSDLGDWRVEYRDEPSENSDQSTADDGPGESTGHESHDTEASNASEHQKTAFNLANEIEEALKRYDAISKEPITAKRPALFVEWAENTARALNGRRQEFKFEIRDFVRLKRGVYRFALSEMKDDDQFESLPGGFVALRAITIKLSDSRAAKLTTGDTILIQGTTFVFYDKSVAKDFSKQQKYCPIFSVGKITVALEDFRALPNVGADSNQSVSSEIDTKDSGEARADRIEASTASIGPVQIAIKKPMPPVGVGKRSVKLFVPKDVDKVATGFFAPKSPDDATPTLYPGYNGVLTNKWGPRCSLRTEVQMEGRYEVAYSVLSSRRQRDELAPSATLTPGLVRRERSNQAR